MFVSSFLIVFVVLFVAWVVGFAFHLLGGLIHLLLLVALISLAVHFARGQPADERRQGSAEECAAERGQREGRRPRPADSPPVWPDEYGQRRLIFDVPRE